MSQTAPFRRAAAPHRHAPLIGGEGPFVASVTRWHDDGTGELADGGICRLAASCLLDVEAGDQVMAVRAAGDPVAWIVAVLTTAGQRTIRLTAPHVAIEATTARWAVERLQTRGASWDAAHDEVRLTSSSLIAGLGAIRAIASRCESWISSAFGWRGVHVRQAEVETLRCTQLDVTARDLMALSTRTGILTAQGLMKIDGEQVTVG